MYGAELAELMELLGAWEAFNLDGGGSTQMWAGGSYVNEDAARFGNGTGLDEKGAYADLDGQGRSLSESGTEVTWYAEDLGLDSRVFEFGFGKPGKYGLEFGYSELPYRRFGDTVTAERSAGMLRNLANARFRLMEE